MSPLPARLMQEGWVVYNRDDESLSRITNVDYVLPGTRVLMDVENQMTGEVSVRGADWEERLMVYEPARLELEGSHGKVGTLLIEPAAVPDDEDRLTYRWRVKDDQGNELDSQADIRSGVGDPYNANEAMERLVGFLGVAAEALEGSESWDLFSDAVREWASQNSDELQMAALELTEGIGLE